MVAASPEAKAVERSVPVPVVSAPPAWNLRAGDSVERQPAVAPVSPAASAVEANEVAEPDQRVAENQYRLAIGLEAKRFLQYPALAQERGWEGVVELWVAFTPSPSISLAKASGHGILDRAAVALVDQAARRVPAPRLLVERRTRVRVVVEYGLRTSNE